MADREIPNLPAADALDGSEQLHVVQAGNSRAATAAAIAGLVDVPAVPASALANLLINGCARVQARPVPDTVDDGDGEWVFDRWVLSVTEDIEVEPRIIGWDEDEYGPFHYSVSPYRFQIRGAAGEQGSWSIEQRIEALPYAGLKPGTYRLRFKALCDVETSWTCSVVASTVRTVIGSKTVTVGDEVTEIELDVAVPPWSDFGSTAGGYIAVIIGAEIVEGDETYTFTDVDFRLVSEVGDGSIVLRPLALEEYLARRYFQAGVMRGSVMIDSTGKHRPVCSAQLVPTMRAEPAVELSASSLSDGLDVDVNVNTSNIITTATEDFIGVQIQVTTENQAARFSRVYTADAEIPE